MPVETAADSPDSRYPVRRSGRQAKRTDKLEEFLSNAKRASRKSNPLSLDGELQPTDVETASEASFDGNPDFKNDEDKVESPERRTRSSTRKQQQQQQQQKSQCGRQTRGGSRVMVKDEESSEDEEDDKDSATEDHKEDKKDQECSVNAGDTKTVQPQAEMESSQSTGVEQKNEHQNENDREQMKKEADKDTDQDGPDKTVGGSAKRGPLRTYVNKKKVTKNTTVAKAPANKTTTANKRETRSKSPQGSKNTRTRQRCTENDDEDEEEDEEDDDDDDDDDDDSSTSSSSESDTGYDPNALYCICRQKHNKRFMICCDRCEEWFHGDCVGITEARGRLMERNGEDYICPNCTTKKNQLVRPATSILSSTMATGKHRPGPPAASCVGSASAEKANSLEDSGQTPAGAPFSAAGSEDVGIKGRIEKATNPTGKKKIKIFQPQPVQPKEGQKVAGEKKAAEQKPVPDTEHKVASNVEVKTTPTAGVSEEKAAEKPSEEASLPKCIGPGCENDAQPDSVYCGNDCILRHAAAAMKSISDDKEPKQEKVKPEKSKPTPKRSSVGGKKTQKTSWDESESEEERSPDPDMDDEDEHAVEERPPPNTASWSSDHNYIAVAAEKTTPISATVLNRKCMYLFEGLGLLMKPLCLFFPHDCVL